MKAVLVLFSLLLNFSAYAACDKVPHSPVDLAQYYASVSGLSGEAQKNGLNSIIKNHTRYSYTPCVWEILKEADQGPQNPDNVIEIYTQRSISKSRKDDGSNHQDSWNRGHIWAKSHGFPDKSQHAYTDTHHLRPADRSVNSDRSNNDFDVGGSFDTECTLCREGSGTREPPDLIKGDVA